MAYSVMIVSAPRLFYTDGYELPLPAGHRFPIEKYRMLRELLDFDGGYALEAAPVADVATIELAHDPEYVRAFVDGGLCRCDDATNWVSVVGRTGEADFGFGGKHSGGGARGAGMRLGRERWRAERITRFGARDRGLRFQRYCSRDSVAASRSAELDGRR